MKIDLGFRPVNIVLSENADPELIISMSFIEENGDKYTLEFTRYELLALSNGIDLALELHDANR
jgi:hypothetical protein